MPGMYMLPAAPHVHDIFDYASSCEQVVIPCSAVRKLQPASRRMSCTCIGKLRKVFRGPARNDLRIA